MGGKNSKNARYGTNPYGYGAAPYGRRAPGNIPPYFPNQGYAAPMAAPTYYSPAASSAMSLDAADGVIDGRYFGRPIAGGAAPYASPYATSYAAPLATPFARTYTAGPLGSSALSLDAADGVIDGRYFGRPIAGAAPSFASPYAAAPVYGSAYSSVIAPPVASSFIAPSYGAIAAPAFSPFGASSSAMALDAADGVIDGRYFGSPIAGAAPAFGMGMGMGLPPMTTYTAATIATPPTLLAGANPALSLDAADGVIDGRFFGAPIAGASPFGAYGAPSVIGGFGGYAAPISTYAPATIAPAFSPFASPFGASSSALALDAADGVLDGRYFGSPIAGASPFGAVAPSFYGSAIAAPYAAPTYTSALAPPVIAY